RRGMCAIGQLMPNERICRCPLVRNEGAIRNPTMHSEQKKLRPNRGFQGVDHERESGDQGALDAPKLSQGTEPDRTLKPWRQAASHETRQCTAPEGRSTSTRSRPAIHP